MSSRKPISDKLAAFVLYCSDRTCCVCRRLGRPVQIHHIDGNRDNTTLSNLAVLCLDCHNATQLQGGFDRKLDADQIILYRDNWHRIVSQQRSFSESTASNRAKIDQFELAVETSIAEIYRENEEFEMLAMHYNSIGNYELRDKYIELALRKNPSDSTICFLRSLQGKPELIPPDVITRRIRIMTKNEDWEQRGRLYDDLGKPIEAVKDYVRGIEQSLDGANIFSAAYYLKELGDSGLIKKLFTITYEQAKADNDLHLMIRSLQELGWKDELNNLLNKRPMKLNVLRIRCTSSCWLGLGAKGKELLKSTRKQPGRRTSPCMRQKMNPLLLNDLQLSLISRQETA